MYTMINKMKFKVKFIKDGHPVAPEGIQDDNIYEEGKAVVNVLVFLLRCPYAHFFCLLASLEMKMTGRVLRLRVPLESSIQTSWMASKNLTTGGGWRRRGSRSGSMRMVPSFTMALASSSRGGSRRRGSRSGSMRMSVPPSLRACTSFAMAFASSSSTTTR